MDGAGFDPDDVARGEGLLAGFATRFGPKDLRRLAEQVVDAIDPDGTRPDHRIQADRRHVTLRPTRDGGFAGEFRLTAEAGVKLQAVLGPLAKPKITIVETGDGQPGGGSPTADVRAADARRPRRRVRPAAA